MNDDDDLDAEFRKLTQDLAADETLSVEEELSELVDHQTCVALVLAPMDNVSALAAFLKMVGLEVPVVRTDPWAAAYVRLEPDSDPDEDALALLTGSRAIPDEVDKIAKAVSKLSAYGAVAVVAWLTEENGFETGLAGSVTAKRYIAGKPEDDLPAGIIMNTLDNVAEDLLLGRATPEDFPDEKGGWKKFFRRPGSKS